MKKWGYLLSGVVIGAMLMTSGSALAAQVKSLVGQKVSGEYTVIVNGKELSDNGAVIDGKTNAPVRALSDAMGGKLDVDNKKKVINIITSEQSVITGDQSEKVDVKKTFLLTDKSTLESELGELQKQKKIKLAEAAPGMEQTVFQQALDDINQQISEKTEKLNKINAELDALDK
ncbi:copper amine oxidase [Paenibacillus sp. D2_2]|uniref:stalk domain-containing protein n=1 Tax=Paenibacillus sp. D2_2 TaxID=3073092 RepID=UPI0028156B22|nr:copper amine oxidase [Paenibacillus sp. D2_2]WMT39746.1 copper amine oxidase [Paenibacillus sp. D2_2]